MKNLLFLFLGLALSLTPIRASEGEIPEDLGSEMPVSEFFNTFQGDYQIIIAGTQVPKEDNKFGSVSIEGSEGLLVFPYCHESGGVCDPGFRSFPLDSTRVYRLKKEENDVLYTLEILEKGTPRYFRWEHRNKIVHFLDEKYTLVSGEVLPLEFIIEKAPVIPPIPVAP